MWTDLMVRGETGEESRRTRETATGAANDCTIIAVELASFIPFALFMRDTAEGVSLSRRRHAIEGAYVYVYVHQTSSPPTATLAEGTPGIDLSLVKVQFKSPRIPLRLVISISLPFFRNYALPTRSQNHSVLSLTNCDDLIRQLEFWFTHCPVTVD